MITEKEMCPVCNIGLLTECKGTHRVTYLAVSGEVNFYYSICSACETEQAGGWQTRVNKDNVLTFHRTVERFVMDKK